MIWLAPDLFRRVTCESDRSITSNGQPWLAPTAGAVFAATFYHISITCSRHSRIQKSYILLYSPTGHNCLRRGLYCLRTYIYSPLLAPVPTRCTKESHSNVRRSSLNVIIKNALAGQAPKLKVIIWGLI